MPPTSTASPGDRRPLKSRSWPIFQRLASWMVRAGVTPNAISIAGMLAAVLAGVLFAGSDRFETGWARPAGYLLAAALLQARLVCNLIDGMVAVEGGRGTPVGELFNEVPDRISDAAVLIGAGYAAGSTPELGYLAALLAVLTAYIRAVGRGAGVGSDYGGPMDKKTRMLVLTVAAVGLAFLPTGSLPAMDLLGRPVGVWSAILMLIAAGCVCTCVFRLRRIAQRLRVGAHKEGSA